MPIFICVVLVLLNPLNFQGPRCCLSSHGMQERCSLDDPKAMEYDRRRVVTLEELAGSCQRLCLGADTWSGVFMAPCSLLSAAQVQTWLNELE